MVIATYQRPSLCRRALEEERRRRQIMKRTALSNSRGFSTIQLLITIAVMAVVTGFAVVSISRARDHVRLMNSARTFAAYVERARADSVRRHAEGANQATVAVVDTNTYAITMDWDGLGTIRTQNFDLERGVAFTDGMVGKSVSFNWRGRILREESFGFVIGDSSVSVGITGSGDVTFDAEYFYASQLPSVTTTGSGGTVQLEPGQTPIPGGSPSASPSPGASPSPTAGASPTATAGASPTSSVNPSPTATANASPTATADPSPTAGASPTAQPCLVNAPDSLTIPDNGSATVSVNRTNATGMGTITATSNNSGQIQVAPDSRSVSGSSSGSFTITVKKSSGSVTFSSSGCTSKTVDITVQ